MYAVWSCLLILIAPFIMILYVTLRMLPHWKLEICNLQHMFGRGEACSKIMNFQNNAVEFIHPEHYFVRKTNRFFLNLYERESGDHTKLEKWLEYCSILLNRLHWKFWDLLNKMLTEFIHWTPQYKSYILTLMASLYLEAQGLLYYLLFLKLYVSTTLFEK